MIGYRKEIYDKVRKIEKTLSQRQIDIRKLIKTSDDEKVKNKLDIERTGNTAILRILSWIKFSLKYMPLGCKLNRDPTFIRWIHCYNYYYMFPTTGDAIGLSKDIYTHTSMRYGTNLSYENFIPRKIYHLIIDNVFQKPQEGIFGLMDEENIEYDEIRNEFDNLIENDWKKFKEMGEV